MGTDNSNHRRKRTVILKKDRSPRKVSWLVVCEGQETEPNYFNALNSYLKNKLGSEYKLDIEVSGQGRNTESLVSKAIALKNNRDMSYMKVFVVFDKDSFENNAFNNAIYRCEEVSMIPIWSNESFELWYLLHYIYTDAQIGRDDYCAKLNAYVQPKYEKNNKKMFELLRD